MGAIAVATTAFVATNIDDIIVLMVFFSQVSPHFRPRHILIGQYLGFLALVLASLPGFWSGQAIPDRWTGWLGLLPIAIGIYQLFKHFTENPEPEEIQTVAATPTLTKSQGWRRWLSPQVLQVAAVTIANGGDNISVYLALFANTNLAQLGVTLIVFFSLVAVWCGIASWLAGHRAITPILTRFGDRLVPFVLIGLGVFILTES